MKKDTQYYARIAKRTLRKIYIESSPQPAKEKPEGKTAKAMRAWNKRNKRAVDRYSITQHSQAPGFDATGIREWNASGNEPQYSKGFYKATLEEKGNITVAAMRMWNTLPKEKNKFSKKEFTAGNPRTADKIFWNSKGWTPKYTEEELNEGYTKK